MASVIYGVLQEEKERNLNMQKAHQAEIDSLKKGSIHIKHNGEKPYYYLVYRKGSKIVQEYIGKDIEVVEKIKNEISKRKYLQDVVKRLKQEYKEISKIVKE